MTDVDTKRDVRESADGWSVPLLYPEGERKTVQVRRLRGRDYRELRTLIVAASSEDDARTAYDFMVEFFEKFTDLEGSEVEGLDIDDIDAVRGVIRDQLGKLER